MEFTSLKRRKRQGRSVGLSSSYYKRGPNQSDELIRRRPRSTERAARNDFELDLLDRKYIELRQLIMKSMTSKLPSEKLIETLKLIFHMNRKRELKRNKVSACRSYSSAFTLQGDQLYPYCNHSSRFKRKATTISDLDSNGSLRNYFPPVHKDEKSRSQSLRKNTKISNNETLKMNDKNLKKKKKTNTTLDSSSSQNSTKYDSKSDVSVESTEKSKKTDRKNKVIRENSPSKSRSRSKSKSKSRSSSSSSSSSSSPSSTSTVKKGPRSHSSRRDLKSRYDLFDETYCWQNCNKEIEKWLNEKNKALKKKRQEERRLAKEKRTKEEKEKLETEARKSASKEKVKIWLEIKKQEEKKQTVQSSISQTTSKNEPKGTKLTKQTKLLKMSKVNEGTGSKGASEKGVKSLKNQDKPKMDHHQNNNDNNKNTNNDSAFNASRPPTKLSNIIPQMEKTSDTESSPRKHHNSNSNSNKDTHKSLQRKISFHLEDQEEALKDLDNLVNKELDEKETDIFGDEIHHEDKAVKVHKQHSIPTDQGISKITSNSVSGSRPSSRTNKDRKMSKAIKMEDFDEMKFGNKIIKDDSVENADETERKELLEENLEQFKRLIIHGNLDENDDEMDNNNNDNNDFDNIFISDSKYENQTHSQYVPTSAKNVVQKSENKTPMDSSKSNEDGLSDKDGEDKNIGESERPESPLLANPWAKNMQRPKTSKRRDILE